VTVLLIKKEVITQELIGETPTFPLYVPFILNQANRNAQGTRPKIVGQMSELIKEFQREAVKKEFEEWKVWYLKKHPQAIDKATEKVYEMILKFGEAMSKIDKKIVRQWIEDLVINETFTGLMFQEVILIELAKQKGVKYRPSTSREESKGIDGYIGNVPVSIKPITYKTKILIEKIEVQMVYYEKLKTGIRITYDF